MQEQIKTPPTWRPKKEQLNKDKDKAKNEQTRNAGQITRDPHKSIPLLITQEDKVPKELKDIDYAQSEDLLRQVVQGADHTWANQKPQDIDQTDKDIAHLSESFQCEEKLFLDTQKEMDKINKHQIWKEYCDNSNRLVAFLKGHSLKEALLGNENIEEAIDK